MLLPQSHPWTLRQRWLIAGAVVAGLVALSALVYTYERYHRPPDDRFFVGTWSGDYVPTTLYFGPAERSFHFRADHTFQGSEGTGKWYAGGDFLYLRLRVDSGGDPYDMLALWHIDSMAGDEVQISDASGHVTLKRGE